MELNKTLNAARKPSYSNQRHSEIMRSFSELKNQARITKISWSDIKNLFSQNRTWILPLVFIAIMMSSASYSLDGKVMSLSKDIKSFQHDVEQSFEELRTTTTFGTTPRTTTQTSMTSAITTSGTELTTTQIHQQLLITSTTYWTVYHRQHL